MKYNFFNWLVETNIYVFIMICWSLSVVLLQTLFDYSYLHKIYTRSWSLSYIIDIKLVLKDENCPSGSGWEKIAIGAWSGFDEGCICSTVDLAQLKTPSEIIPKEISYYVTDKKGCNIDSKVKEIYSSCIEIPYIRPYMLNTYKGVDICAQYSSQNYTDISNTFNSKLSKVMNMDNHDFPEYLKSVNKVDMSDFIIQSAITDIKFVNTTTVKLETFSANHEIDINKYEIIKIKADYVMLIKRLSNEDDELKKNGLKTIRSLINDIHLYNDLWCAYLDISVPLDKMDLNKGQVEFGYDYCNKFYSQSGDITRFDPNHYIISYRKELFYNDAYFRTNKINFEDFDDTFYNSKYDFYNWNHEITKLYNSLLYKVLHSSMEINPSTHDEKYRNFFVQNGINPAHYSPIIMDGSYGPNFKPVLVYENYLEGIGCFKFLETKEHINMLDDHKTLRGIAKLIVGINSLIFLLLVVNYIAKGLDSKCFTSVIYGTIVLINFIGFIASAYLSAFLRKLRNYFIDYQFFCQNDFTLKYSSSSTLPMEVAFTKSIGYSLIGSTANAALLFFSLILCIIMTIRVCCNKDGQGENENQVIEFQHKKVDDQSDVRSKIPDISATYRKDDDNQVV